MNLGPLARQVDSVLILAGGMGRRMGGTDKAFVQFEGESLISRALSLAASFGPVRVASSRSRAAYEALGINPIEDAVAGFAGPLSGLLAGFEALGHGLLLSLPVDLVGPQASDLQKLIDTALAQRCCCYADLGDHRHPLLAVWRVEPALTEQARSILLNGTGAVRALQDAIDALPVDLQPRAGHWRDLNQPQG